MLKVGMGFAIDLNAMSSDLPAATSAWAAAVRLGVSGSHANHSLSLTCARQAWDFTIIACDGTIRYAYGAVAGRESMDSLELAG